MSENARRLRRQRARARRRKLARRPLFDSDFLEYFRDMSYEQFAEWHENIVFPLTGLFDASKFPQA
tara:strand:- start:15 stop:212 length:198 start_codon:yes stop_codon:yes gene_type:complete